MELLQSFTKPSISLFRFFFTKMRTQQLFTSEIMPWCSFQGRCVIAKVAYTNIIIFANTNIIIFLKSYLGISHHTAVQDFYAFTAFFNHDACRNSHEKIGARPSAALILTLKWYLTSPKTCYAKLVILTKCTFKVTGIISRIRMQYHIMAETNGRYFADDIFKCIFLNENIWISINISLKFAPKGQINNIPTLVLCKISKQLGNWNAQTRFYASPDR